MFSQASVILFTGVCGRHPPRQTLSLGRQPPLGRHPPAQCMLGYTHPSPQRPLQRTVRILLECILLVLSFGWKCNTFEVLYRLNLKINIYP